MTEYLDIIGRMGLSGLQLLSGVFNTLMSIGVLFAGFSLAHSVFRKEVRAAFRNMLREHHVPMLVGAGLTGLALLLFHSFKIPTWYDIRQGSIECDNCHSILHNTTCPTCGHDVDMDPYHGLMFCSTPSGGEE